MIRNLPHKRSDYFIGRTFPTRWMDNDTYGHINNVIYYNWFDTAVNTMLIERGLLDLENGQTIGLVVESSCIYMKAISFPQEVTAMLRIGHLGRSSVRYEIALFADGEDFASAQGHFIHVYVDRKHRRPKPLPALWRKTLTDLIMS